MKNKAFSRYPLAVSFFTPGRCFLGIAVGFTALFWTILLLLVL